MSFRSPGRNNSDPLTAFRVGHVQDRALAHAQHVPALFAVSLALIDPLDRERVAKRLDGFVEGNAVIAEILDRFRVAPLKTLIFHRYGISVVFASVQDYGITVHSPPTFFARLRRAAMASSPASLA